MKSKHPILFSFLIFFSHSVLSAVLDDTKLKAALSAKFKSRSSSELEMMFNAVKGADKLASATDVYAPNGNTSEKNASTYGLEGLTLIRAHQMALYLPDNDRATNYRKRLVAISNGLAVKDNFDDSFVQRWTDSDTSNDPLGLSKPYPLGHRNYNRFNLFGWGRIWSEDKSPENVYAGGYTYFYQEPNCNTYSPVGSLISRPYQEENYDTGYASKFLIENFLYFKSKGFTEVNSSWLDSGMRSLNTFMKKSNGIYDFATQFQATETSQHLYINKTTGPCEKNYLILNTNMIMASGYQSGATALARGYSPASSLYESNFANVVDRILLATNYEIYRKNYGYYSYKHQIEGYGGLLKSAKADSHQTVLSDGKIVCKSSSCLLHLPIESLQYYLIGAQKGWWKNLASNTTVQAYAERVYKIQTEFETGLAAGNYPNPLKDQQSQTIGYLCHYRNLPLPSQYGGYGYVNLKSLCQNRIVSFLNLMKIDSSVKPNVFTISAFLNIEDY